MKMNDLLIVTGGSRGIGGNIVRECSVFFATTIALSSSGSLPKDLNIMSGTKITALKQDLANPKSVYDSIKGYIATAEKLESIGIVLCAAQLGSPGGLFSSDLQEWNNLFQINLLGNLSVLKACDGPLFSRVKVRVVFLAGGGAAYGYPDFSGYALSKVAVVRAVENIAMEFSSNHFDASIIALAPGAVSTEMLEKVIAHGGLVKTKTDISEPTTFVKKFLLDEIDSLGLNGRFIHVRDDLGNISRLNSNKDLLKLRRIE